MSDPKQLAKFVALLALLGGTVLVATMVVSKVGNKTVAAKP